MILDRVLYERFRRAMAEREQADLEKAFHALESLIEEAVELGAWPPPNPLEGIETDIRVAAVLNSIPGRCAKNSFPL